MRDNLMTAAEELKTILGRAKVIDLTVTIAPDLPCNPPEEPPFFMNLLNHHSGGRGPFVWHYVATHDHTGTHCDAPNHFVPHVGVEEPRSYSGENLTQVEEFIALRDYYLDPSRGVAEFAPHPAFPNRDALTPAAPAEPPLTLDQLPLKQLMGPAAVIDVRHLIEGAPEGETTVLDRSPEIAPEDIEQWESANGPLDEGDIVLLYTGWSDRYYRRLPEGSKFDRSHPAPNADTIAYLSERGVRTVGTDGQGIGLLQDDLSGHWALGVRGMVAIEKLTNLGELPARGAFFVFLPWKVEGVSGGMGRAIGIV